MYCAWKDILEGIFGMSINGIKVEFDLVILACPSNPDMSVDSIIAIAYVKIIRVENFMGLRSLAYNFQGHST